MKFAMKIDTTKFITHLTYDPRKFDSITWPRIKLRKDI